MVLGKLSALFEVAVVLAAFFPQVFLVQSALDAIVIEVGGVATGRKQHFGTRGSLR